MIEGHRPDLTSEPISELTAHSSKLMDRGRTALLSLSVALRSVGKYSSPDQIEQVRKISPELSFEVERCAERMPRATGRALGDLLSEARSDQLRRQLWDPRSYRAAADAVERFLAEAPDRAVAAFGCLPEERFPLKAMKKLGLFLLGFRLRGVDAVEGAEGRAKVSDTDLSVPELVTAGQRMDGWHRSYASAAYAQASGEAPPSFGGDPSAARPVVEIPEPLRFSSEQADRLSSFVRLEDDALSPDDRLAFRRVVVYSLFLFLRLLQRPFASRFQQQVCFGPCADGSSFERPLVVLCAPDADPFDVVRSLSTALDHVFASGPGPCSAEHGPLAAFCDLVSAETGVPKHEAFPAFTEAYLRVLAAQQGDAPKGDLPGRVDRGVVSRHHALYLEVLLDEQKGWLQRSARRKATDQLEDLVAAGVGAAGLGGIAAFLRRWA